METQQKTLDIQRGLFLIKYESSETPDYPPRVHIGAAEGSENSIELILPPDVGEATLWSPGASLVARATRPSRLHLVVAASEPNGSTAARVQVLSLSNDPAGARERDMWPLDLSDFRVLGHVAGRGDVVVEADSWIAGPSSPSRIEGIAIQWPGKPRDLNLRYAVTVGDRRQNPGQFVNAGDFAGTRGRALPLVGVTLEVSGNASAQSELEAEALFLGSPPMKVVGRRVVLSGPTGREPLVGLRVRLEATESAERVAVMSASPERDQKNSMEHQRPAKRYVAPSTNEPQSPTSLGPKAQSSLKRSGRVRVFRSTDRKPTI